MRNECTKIGMEACPVCDRHFDVPSLTCWVQWYDEMIERTDIGKLLKKDHGKIYQEKYYWGAMKHYHKVKYDRLRKLMLLK